MGVRAQCGRSSRSSGRLLDPLAKQIREGAVQNAPLCYHSTIRKKSVSYPGTLVCSTALLDLSVAHYKV